MNLNEENFLRTTLHEYNNQQLNTVDEFKNDINRISCIRKIIDRYLVSKNINVRLIINHIVILHNLFDTLVVDMLMLKLDEKHMGVVKAILVFLEYIDADDWNDVLEDSVTFNKLREL